MSYQCSVIRAPINQPSATRNPPTHNPQSAITAYNASKRTDPLIPTFFCRFALTIGHELRHEVGPLPALALRERRPGLRSEKRRTPSRPVYQATYQATYERGMRAEESSVISPTSTTLRTCGCTLHLSPHSGRVLPEERSLLCSTPHAFSL